MTQQITPTSINITNLRKRLGFTQAQVATYLGLPSGHATISYYETGERGIPLDVLEKLADLYCVELYDLMEEDSLMQSVNIAFAYRADEVEAKDLVAISQFNKMVKNYLKIKRLRKNAAQ